VGVRKWQVKVYKQQDAMRQQNHAMLFSVAGGVDHLPPVKLQPLPPLSHKIDNPTTTTRIFKTAMPACWPAGLPSLMTVPATARATSSMITLENAAAAFDTTLNTTSAQTLMTD
ncbi:hypothetical protein VaNZ11_002178, partial [Volvox africanus]